MELGYTRSAKCGLFRSGIVELSQATQKHLATAKHSSPNSGDKRLARLSVLLNPLGFALGRKKVLGSILPQNPNPENRYCQLLGIIAI